MLSDRHMLACRLCLELGIDDPVAWLENVPREVLRTWMAFDSIEPIGGGTRNQARIAYEIACLKHLFLAVNSKADAKLPKHPSFEEFMPARTMKLEKKKPKKNQSGLDIGQQLAARFGG